jgi:hypothetical protein
MYATCRHIKTNGLRCDSPALKDCHFCYYHSKTHIVGAEPDAKYGPLHLPTPEDAASVQLSVALISDALINGRIDLKKATGLFYGLQIASRFVDPKSSFNPRYAVQFAEQSPQGDEIALPEYECDDDEDCSECPFSDNCPNCLHPGDDGYEEAEDDEGEECEDDEDEPDEEDEDSDEEEDVKTEEELSRGVLQKKRQPVPDGLDALRRSLAKVLDERSGAKISQSLHRALPAP